MTVQKWLHRPRVRRYTGFLLFLARRFDEDDAFNMASSLSYTSLLSVVPLFAIGLAMLAAFPTFNGVRQQIEETLFRYAVPEVGEQIQQYVSSFVGNAGRLTAAGVMGLGFTAIMLLIAIESSLNTIFRVDRARSSVSRLLLYWTALTLGPLLVGASLSLSAWFFAAERFADRLGLSWLTSLAGPALPNLLMVVAFSLLYTAVPNRRVPFRPALIGGVCAALVTALLRWGFGIYVGHAHTYQSVYGAVALVPIFLFWMYLSWVVVLIGAEITAALPEWARARTDPRHIPQAKRRVALALSILASLWEQARQGGPARSRSRLLADTAEAESAFSSVMVRLAAHGLVVLTARNRYVLGRDLGRVTLHELLNALELDLGAGETGPAWSRPSLARVFAHLDQATAAGVHHLDIPIASLLEEDPVEAESTPGRGADGRTREVETNSQ